MTVQLKEIGQLLQPSWLSGLIAIVAGLALVTATVFALHYNGSNIQLLQQVQANKPHDISQNTESLDDGLTANQLISDIPLFIMWAGIGLLVYSLTMAIIGAFSRVHNLEQEINYVHANRDELLREALIRFAVRAGALIVWLLYIQLTIHVLLPYIIALIYAGSGSLGLLVDTGYLLGALVFTVLVVHLHTVMLRLVLLKSRAFGQVMPS